MGKIRQLLAAAVVWAASSVTVAQAEILIGLILPTAKGGHELVIYVGEYDW